MIKAPQIPSSEAFCRHIICVSGSMAAGKNAVADVCARNGYICLDADSLVHQILARPEVQQKVLQTFDKAADERGISLTAADGSLNRRSLGALLFSAPELLQQQEAIIHPLVDAEIARFVAEHPCDNIVLNAAVLYKIKAICLCDTVFFVTAPVLTRLRRAKKRDGMKKSLILARFWQQRNLFAKYKKLNADVYRVKNTGTLQALEKKVDALLGSLNS